MLTLKAIQLSQPIGDFLIAAIPAEKLVEICYTDVRRLDEEDREVELYLGIQRPLVKKRVREIRDYVRTVDATFPTAVILAVDERCTEYDPKTLELTIFPFEDPDGDNVPMSEIAKILDGQHRIAGFLDDDGNFITRKSPFDINVAIFVGADLPEQANIFATVNLAQTKVNRSLVYDLAELARNRSPYKTCHNVAVMLDRFEDGPFYHRIKRLGVATPGRAFEPLTQAAFVEALMPFISTEPNKDRDLMMQGRRIRPERVDALGDTPLRNLFLKEEEEAIAEILLNYFTAVRRRWPKAWDAIGAKGNLLPKSNAFKALMKYLKEDVYSAVVEQDYGAVPKSAEFRKFFSNVKIEDTDFTTRNFAPGSGGQSRFLKLLRGEISVADLLA